MSYINLAKRFLQEHSEVQLSALGIAVRRTEPPRVAMAGRALSAVGGARARRGRGRAGRLSARARAQVSPMVTVAEILKGRRLAVVKKVVTSLESLSGEYRCGCLRQPAPLMLAAATRAPAPGPPGADLCVARVVAPARLTRAARAAQDAPEAEDGGAAGEVGRVRGGHGGRGAALRHV